MEPNESPIKSNNNESIADSQKPFVGIRQKEKGQRHHAILSLISLFT
jgi:hypothetical protein